MPENTSTLAVYVVHIAVINEALRAGSHFVCKKHFYKSIVHKEGNRLRLGVISYALIPDDSYHPSCVLCDLEEKGLLDLPVQTPRKQGKSYRTSEGL